jgi:hypothetical protein
MDQPYLRGRRYAGSVVDLFETERLRLRPFAADLSDLDALHEIQSDPHHMRFYPHPFSREESRAWIEKFVEWQERNGYSLWAIEDRETGEFLGNAARRRSWSTAAKRSRSDGRSRHGAHARGSRPKRPRRGVTGALARSAWIT